MTKNGPESNRASEECARAYAAFLALVALILLILLAKGLHVAVLALAVTVIAAAVIARRIGQNLR